MTGSKGEEKGAERAGEELPHNFPPLFPLLCTYDTILLTDDEGSKRERERERESRGREKERFFEREREENQRMREERKERMRERERCIAGKHSQNLHSLVSLFSSCFCLSSLPAFVSLLLPCIALLAFSLFDSHLLLPTRCIASLPAAFLSLLFIFSLTASSPLLFPSSSH